MLAPRLELLHLIAFPGAYNIDIAWSQITELTIEGCDLPPEEAQRLLIEIPNIRRCRLHISRSSLPIQPIESSVICLFHLESFTLLERGPFTPKVRAPNIKQLIYEAYRSDREHFDIFELIKDQEGYPTGPSLEVLTFDPTTTLPETIVRFLMFTPNVKELTLEIPDTRLSCMEWKWNSRSEFGDKFLSALIPVESRPFLCSEMEGVSDFRSSLASWSALCPKLERFKCTSRAGFTDAMLLAFIRSRLSPSVDIFQRYPKQTEQESDVPSCLPLRQVIVKFDPPVEVDIFDELRDSSSCSVSEQVAGLDLRLEYKKGSKPLTNARQRSAWNGIRSREAVPACITWVLADEDSFA